MSDYRVSTLICPIPNTNSYGDESSLPTPSYKLSSKEITRIMLGEKFVIDEKEVNSTYSIWIGNLCKLVRGKMISSTIKDGLIAVNPFNRSEKEDTTGTNMNDNRPDFFYPPYVI